MGFLNRHTLYGTFSFDTRSRDTFNEDVLALMKASTFTIMLPIEKTKEDLLSYTYKKIWGDNYEL